MLWALPATCIFRERNTWCFSPLRVASQRDRAFIPWTEPFGTQSRPHLFGYRKQQGKLLYREINASSDTKLKTAIFSHMMLFRLHGETYYWMMFAALITNSESVTKRASRSNFCTWNFHNSRHSLERPYTDFCKWTQSRLSASNCTETNTAHLFQTNSM